MRPKVLSIILIFSLALNLAVVGTFIFRQIDRPVRPVDGPPFDPDREPFFEEMNLDDNQRIEMQKLMHEFREFNMGKRQMIFELEDQVMKTLRSEDFDTVKADSLIERIGHLRMEQTKQAIKHFRKFNKFLSPEQQAHFHNMIMERPVGRHPRQLHRWRESGGMPDNRHGRLAPDSMNRMDSPAR